MRNVWAIFKREFRSFWNTPVAYVVMVLFLIITGFFFTFIFNYFVQISNMYQQMAAQMPDAPTLSVSEGIFQPFFGVTVIFVFIFLLPLITMRLLAEEKASGTIELLFTYPIKEREIVAGKYLSALGFLLVMIGCTLLYPLMIHIINPGSLNLRVLMGGYLGFFLIGAVFLAVGTFFSSVTSNQITAAALTIGCLLLLYFMGFVKDAQQLPPQMTWFGNLCGYLSFNTHYMNFTKGLIITSDVVYGFVMIALFLFLTLRTVEIHRWKG